MVEVFSFGSGFGYCPARQAFMRHRQCQLPRPSGPGSIGLGRIAAKRAWRMRRRGRWVACSPRDEPLRTGGSDLRPVLLLHRFRDATTKTVVAVRYFASGLDLDLDAAIRSSGSRYSPPSKCYRDFDARFEEYLAERFHIWVSFRILQGKLFAYLIICWLLVNIGPICRLFWHHLASFRIDASHRRRCLCLSSP